MATRGKIVSWNDAKGYGFIAPESGGSKVFCHIKAFADRNRRPSVGDAVTFAADRDDRGRLRASQATLPSAKMRRSPKRGSIGAASWVAITFLGALAASTYLGHLPAWVFYGCTGFSTITFIVYAVDKSAAQYGRWRTREATLHLLALAGGWPGALIAQKVLRHKSRKRSFLTTFWLTVVLNVAAIAYMHTPDGKTWIDAVLAEGRELLDSIPGLR